MTVQGVSEDKHKFDDDPEVQSILLDFDSLDFSSGQFNHHLYDMNYNKGKEANPFDKIAKYYRRKKNVFLFVDMVFHKEKEIMDIISKKCDTQAREKFRERMKIYSDRIGQGINDAKEFLNSDLTAFFNGYYIACRAQTQYSRES